MTFLGVTEHFSGKNGALRWSILVGKQKHNVQRPSTNSGLPTGYHVRLYSYSRSYSQQFLRNY